MTRLLLAIVAVNAALASAVQAQDNEASPPPAASAPGFPSPPPLPPGVGPQIPRWNDSPGAQMPPPRAVPGAPGAIGAPPLPPGVNQPPDQLPPANLTQSTATPPPPQRASLISFLESSTPFVQAFDVVLMLACGIYCLRSTRRRKNTGITILAISCFVATIILLGFFLSAAPNGQPLFPFNPQVRGAFYMIARILAPFELLLFALGIIFVARANRS